MILNCPSCKTRYLVPDSAIGPAGRQVRCASCRHSWFQDGAAAVPEPAVEPSPGIVPAPPDKPAPPIATPPMPQDYATPQSSFAHEPPFKPRRNPARLWTFAAIGFAVLALGGAGALYAFGPPGWFESVQIAQGADTDLLIELNPDQERRTLPDGTDFFAASGTIINPTGEEQPVPPLLVMLRDAGGRVVYSWQMKPPRNRIAPGEKLKFNEAKLDVPRAATQLEVRWGSRDG